jgi:predicted DNA-binding antitoxin AbrB/MazE fold protein
MSQQIDAIYDNGVFKPLVPLVLPDKTRVKLTLQADETQPDSDVIARQQAALEELRHEIDALPQTRNNDGWSVRQHDELLYGRRK